MKNPDQDLVEKLVNIQAELQELDQAFKTNLKGIRQNTPMIKSLAVTFKAYKKQVAALQPYDIEFPQPSFPNLEKCLVAVEKPKPKNKHNQAILQLPSRRILIVAILPMLYCNGERKWSYFLRIQRILMVMLLLMLKLLQLE
ncbi:MAG: hypothetical protein AB8E82_13345 [Aureispira sp.]